MKYEQRYDGDWFRVTLRGHRLMCCDCGLVHRVEFRIVKHGHGNRIEMRAWRHKRATAAARRKKP